MHLRLDETQKYAQLIKDTQLHFIQGAIITFGACGPQATQFVDDAANFYSAKCAMDNGVCRKQLVERVQGDCKIFILNINSCIYADQFNVQSDQFKVQINSTL